MPDYYNFERFHTLAKECRNMAAKIGDAEQAAAWRKAAAGWIALTKLADQKSDKQPRQKQKNSN